MPLFMDFVVQVFCHFTSCLQWLGECGWMVGVIDGIMANSAPNRVGVGARAELGTMIIPSLEFV